MDDDNVEFLDPEHMDTVANRSYNKSIYSPLILWLIEKHIFKTERAAHTAIVILISVLFGLSLIFIYIGLQYTTFESKEPVVNPGAGFTQDNGL